MWEVLGLAGGVPKLLHLVVRHSCGMEMEKWQGGSIFSLWKYQPEAMTPGQGLFWESVACGMVGPMPLPPAENKLFVGP